MGVTPPAALTPAPCCNTILPMAQPRDIGIVGCGTIGRKMAAEIDRGAVPGASLAALNSRDMHKAAAFAATLSAPPPVLPLDELAAASDMVVETATGEALDAIARAAPSARAKT